MRGLLESAKLSYEYHRLNPAVPRKLHASRRRFPFGAAGNAWITAAVYQTLTGMLDQKLGPQRALELPRFLLAGQRTFQGPAGAVK
jgi:gamma-glutamyltranspeptidase / glutathione hydrolase